jgi:hypothetical protein
MIKTAVATLARHTDPASSLRPAGKSVNGDLQYQLDSAIVKSHNAVMAEGSALVRDWTALFNKTPLAARVVMGLEKQAAEIWERTFRLLQEESPEYRNSVDEEFTLESQSHCKELLESIVRIGRGRVAKTDTDPFDFVRSHAQWRAQHQVPLVASLHAYRLAHKTYSGITKEHLLAYPRRDDALLALAMLSDFWIEFFDFVGSLLMHTHAVEEGQTIARNSQAYHGLIENLLRGIEPENPEEQRLRAVCGIRPGVPLAVAVGRLIPSAKREQFDAEAALRSLVRLIQQELPSADFGKLVAYQNAQVTAIVCSRSSPGLGLMKILRRQGFAKRSEHAAGMCLGISGDATDTSALPEALQEARLALEFASPAHPLKCFRDIDLPEFLIRRADKAALRLIPEWTRQLTDGNGAAEDLSRTIRAFADRSLNVKQTALHLGVHTNTVYFRLNQIKLMTGVDPRTFSGLSLLTTALRLAEANGVKDPDRWS